jgi:glutathione synthase/RimK-type ligase-like ATP-grasp enzyme
MATFGNIIANTASLVVESNVVYIHDAGLDKNISSSGDGPMSTHHLLIQHHHVQDDNNMYVHLTETDYNLLRNITTQVGSYYPLPSSFDKASKIMKPKRFIPMLEARGGTDKDEFGHRRDTIPIATAIDEYVHRGNGYYEQELGEGKGEVEEGVDSAVFQFLEEEDGQNQLAVQSNLALKRYLKETSHGVISRNNPGSLSPSSQQTYDNMLRELSEDGVVILTHPDVTSTLGAKDSLVKIKHLKCGLEDTEVYYDPEAFRQGFRKSIAFQPRVIKQNRGSQGEGVWIVKLKDENAYCDTYGACMVSLDTEIVLMEAFDNHVEHHTVGEFIEFCIHGRTNTSATATEWTTTSGGKYFEGGLVAGAMVVDQRFLPRIVEGEVRCLMVGPELVEIVHKKPKEGGLSATLQSGAIYTKYSPDDVKFAKLTKNFKEDIPRIMDSFAMSGQPLPLLWTLDYIYGDTDDELYAGEINCSCIGITQQLYVAPTVAKVAFESVFTQS